MILAAILLCFLAFLAISAYVLLRIRHVYIDIIDFLTPQSDTVPSALATVMQSAASMIGSALVASAKGFLMGQKSIEKRQASAEAGEAISASPIGGIVNLLPNSVKKSIIKNPQLLDMAMGLFAQKSESSPSGGNGQSASRAKFNL